MKLKIGIALVMFGSTFSYAETLDSMVKKSIIQHPQVLEAYYNYESSKHELESMEGKNLPTLDFRAEKGREKTKTPANEQNTKTYNEEQISLVGRYNLFSGLKITNQIAEKREAVNLSKNQLNEKINTVSFLTIQIYLDVLRKKYLFDIAEKNHNLHVSTLSGVETRVRLGEGYESDVQQTKARVDLAESQKIIAEKNYLNTQLKYQRLLHELPIVDSMTKPNITTEYLTSNVDEDIKKIEHQNFQVQIKKSKKNIANYVYKQQSSKYYPIVDLEISQNWNEDVYGIQGPDKSSKIALVLNYNLYNGGSDRAIQLAKLKQRDMSLQSIEDTKLSIVESLKISVMQYDMLKRQISLLENQLSHLARTSELYENEYKNSKRTIIDVLNVKQEYNYAESQKINVEFDRLLSYYQYKSLLGKLLETLSLENLEDISFDKASNKRSSNTEDVDKNHILTKALEASSINR